MERWHDRIPLFSSQNRLQFIHTVLYQNALWHGNDCLIFRICEEDRLIIYMHDDPMGVYPRTTVFILSFIKYILTSAAVNINHGYPPLKKLCPSVVPVISSFYVNKDNHTILFVCVQNG
jgi:hypothetical protein